MAESAKKKAEPAKVAAVPDLEGEEPRGSTEDESSAHRGEGCPVALCPICGAVDLLRPINPEVVEHLLSAGREFLLAAKAALEALTTRDEPNDDDDSMERIDIG